MAENGLCDSDTAPEEAVEGKLGVLSELREFSGAVEEVPGAPFVDVVSALLRSAADRRNVGTSGKKGPLSELFTCRGNSVGPPALSSDLILVV